MRIVAVVGYSESGKTRLIVRLIRELKRRGARVAALKRCSHGFSLDTEGKDTADFSRAGAEGVAMLSPEGWAALGHTSETDAVRLARRLFPAADVVLIEGGKDVRGVRKVEVLRDAGTGPVSPADELIAVVFEGPVPGAAAPVFSPDDVEGVSDLILSQEEDDMAKITLEIDGREINMNAFVQSFIEKTVVGMVTSLSGVDPEPRRITLVIDRPAETGQGGPKP